MQEGFLPTGHINQNFRLISVCMSHTTMHQRKLSAFEELKSLSNTTYLSNIRCQKYLKSDYFQTNFLV